MGVLVTYWQIQGRRFSFILLLRLQLLLLVLAPDLCPRARPPPPPPSPREAAAQATCCGWYQWNAKRAKPACGGYHGERLTMASAQARCEAEGYGLCAFDQSINSGQFGEKKCDQVRRTAGGWSAGFMVCPNHTLLVCFILHYYSGPEKVQL